MPKFIAANWKMNKIRSEAKETAMALSEALKKNLPDDRRIFLFPPFPSLSAVSECFANFPKVSIGAQNFYPEDRGAFTGEVSLRMLKDCGCTGVMIGHSERRHILHESDEFIGKKTAYAVKNGFGVMLCVGETLEERESGNLKEVLSRQLKSALTESLLSSHSDEELKKTCLIAYEPVWAIGTGKVAGPHEVLEAHCLVKELLQSLHRDVSFLPVLYGGSVNAKNAGELLAIQHVDGLLVGGASLEAESFLKIINA